MQGRKLTVEEVEQLESKHSDSGNSREVTRQLYDSLLADFSADEYGELTLGDGEKKPTVRKHVVSAFRRKGLMVDWKRGSHNTLRFHVTEYQPEAQVQA